MLTLFIAIIMAAAALTIVIYTLRRSPRVLTRFQTVTVFLSFASLLSCLVAMAFVVVGRI